MHDTSGAYLDLSPPPLDPAGFPLRIDGLDVAAGMLARALGVSPATPLIAFWAGRWVLTVPHPGRLGDAPLSSLNIDPTSPLAPRLAMVAIMRARPWSTR